MHKNLGNIIFMLFFVSLEGHAWVQTNAPKSIVKTETLEFSIVAKGFNVKFPKIKYIDGFVVNNTKTTHEAVIINTRKADKISKVYSLTPDKNITLPAFSITVDDKIEKTLPLHVTLTKLTQTRSPDYKLSMNISNKTPMVGEKFMLHVKLVYKDLADYEVITPLFANFSVKEISDKEYKNDKGEWVEVLQYEIMPQKSGKFVLHPVKAKIELVSPKYKRRNIYSNALEITVKSIPKNLSTIGIYKINASVNTTHIRKNQPVKYTLMLQGSGNINNFDDVNISIPYATVYAHKIIKLHKKGREIYKKSFEIVCDKNFTIPSVSLEYFDTKEQRVKEITTQAFAIHVENAVPVKITKKEEKVTMMEKAVYFLAGAVATLFLLYMYKVVKNIKRPDKQKEVKKELQNIHSKEKFLKKVVPYLGKNKSLDRLIYRLENVENAEFKQLKKEIIAKLIIFVL